MTARENKKCRESLVFQTHRIFPGDLNSYGALFGGALMAWIDNTSSISISRHCRMPAMTAATDKIDFLHPLYDNHSVCVETYVSGVGQRSMEVFAKIMGEDLMTGERYLAATSFMTFAVLTDDTNYQVPLIEPETEEERFVCAGYEQRRAVRLAQRKFNVEFAEKVTMNVPWQETLDQEDEN